MRFLKALPPYFGGKQKLLGTIFAQMPKPAEAPVLVDAFLGGGSISLYAKAKGYTVLCNDISLRSAVVGRALIENDRVKLTETDMWRLLRPNDYRFVRDHLAHLFTPEDAETLDTMMGNIRGEMDPESVRYYLYLLVVILFVLRYRKYGDFGNEGIYWPLVNRENAMIKKTHFKSVQRIVKPPTQKLAAVIKAINSGVFGNGKENKFTQSDVLDFLDGVNAQADIIYFDPPYYGCTSYEETYQVLDSILAGSLVKPNKSGFNKEGALNLLREMFRRATKAPLWIISYGGPKVGVQDLIDVVQEFRPAQAVQLEYTYNFGNVKQDSEGRETEFLIRAERGAG